MRNVKKFLALVLAMLMVVSAAATVSAFEDVADDHVFAAAINDLTVKEIVNGYDGETFGPDDAVTRQQMALMMARAITGNVGDDAVWAQGGLVGFEDVTEYQYAIATVVKAGIVDGFLDNTFRPEEGITFVQALKMAVCALGYDDGNLEWWNGYYNVALDLGLTENLNYITDADKALNRGEVAQLIYNMLYVELADGSDCFASQNFGLATADNLTTFIITATDEQTAYEGMDVAEGGYVGLQTLVNGVPAGDVVYVPVEVFGFEDDEDEAAFLSAYNLVNWNEDEATFDQIIPVGESWKIYNAEISGIKNGKFAYDGKNYYPVEELTGTAIKNEVVLYNSTDFGYDNGNKVLFLNAQGQVMHKSGDYAVLEAVYSVTGDIVSYRVLRDDADTNVVKGSYLSVSKATALYGAIVDEVAQSYTIVDTAALTGAYELTVFDDNMDGKMDRAYWTPVYLAVYAGFTSTDKHVTAGPFYNHDEGDNGKITGMEDLTKGDVFVYTYNEQLQNVTVLEVLEQEQGTVKRINTTKKSASDGYSTITLTDGTALTLYNVDTKASTAETKIGAEFGAHSKGAVDYTKEEWMTQFVDSFKVELVDDTELLAALEAGSLIRYYARNGVVIFAETYNIDDVFTRVILKEVVDADLDAIYADVYVGDEVEEIAITSYNGKDLADVSWIKMSSIVGELDDLAGDGKVFKIAETENGYQMSVELDDAEGSNADDFKLILMAEVDSDNELTDDVYAQDIEILDNIAELPGVTGYNKYNRLRTTENTIWYFINREADKDTTVKVFSGELDEAKIVLGNNTRIFVDKLGYAGDNKGEATVVYVYDADLAESYGFGWDSGDVSIIYVSAAINTLHTWDYYEAGDAEELGLDEKAYTDNSYYLYNSKYIMDMYSGKATTVFSDYPLLAGNFYYVNEDGYVVGTDNEPVDDELVTSSTIAWDADIYDDRYRVIEDVLAYDFEIKTLCVLAAASDSIKTSSSDIDDIITTAGVEAWYLAGYDVADADEVDEDGRFAIVVGDLDQYDADYEADPEADTLPNAYYQYNNKTHMGVIEDVAATTAKISATLKFSADQSDDIDYSEKISLEELLTLNPALVDDMIVYIGTDKAVTSIFNGSVEADGYDFTCEIEDNEIIFEATAGQMKGSPDVKKFTLAKDTLYRVAIEVQVGEASQWAVGYFKLAADVK